MGIRGAAIYSLEPHSVNPELSVGLFISESIISWFLILVDKTDQNPDRAKECVRY